MNMRLIGILLPVALFAGNCGPKKMEVFFPAHVENGETHPAEIKCVGKKEKSWKGEKSTKPSHEKANSEDIKKENDHP